MNNSLYKPTYLIELCKKYKLTPSKKYGQNYLISDSPINKMIEAGELKKTDTVVEIGPGFGILTLAVAPLVKRLITFEIERKLEGYWDEKVGEFDNIEVVWGNALKRLKTYDLRHKKFKVLANLPYQVTSNVLRTILELENKPEKVIVMVQKEVAERICAKPARKASPRTKGDMSLLAVSVQYYGEPRIVKKVSRNSFWPAPKVDSAVLEISGIKNMSGRDEAMPRLYSDDEFFKFVKAGFASKRKQLWRNLSKGLGLSGDDVKKALKDVVGNEKVRAQELSVGEWKKLVGLLK